jgi:hypothetical protein
VLPPASPPPPAHRDPRDARHVGATDDYAAHADPTYVTATRYLPLTGDAYDVAEPGAGYLDAPRARHRAAPTRDRARPRYELESPGVDGALAAYVVGVVLLLVALLVVLPLVLA